MQKISTPRNQNVSPDLNDQNPDAELANAFWRWFSISVFVLLVAAAIPAFSADVFIDEGDGDFAATPVSTPAAPAVTAPNAVVGDKKPASEDVPPAGPGAGSDIDSSIGELEPPKDPSSADAGETNKQKMNEMMATPPAGEKKHSKKASAKGSKKSAKGSKKSSKASKKSGKKKAEKKKSDKKKKSKKNVATSKKSSKRAVASITKFAGGEYLTTSRSCPLESSPGAGDSTGVAKASRKLWVEDSGNTSYYKVYSKGGQPAFVSRDCF